MTAKKITVRVTLDLVIDTEMWNEINGRETTKAAITRDVRDYTQNAITQISNAIIDATETHKA